MSQCNLAWFYLNGTGVEQNLERAFELFSKSAEQGNLRGKYNVGLCYDKGDGVHKDRVKAAEYFQDAAVRGHVGAMLKLANYTEHGLGGLTADPAKALEWYRRAAAEGDEIAAKEVERLEKDGVSAPTASTSAPAPETPPAPAPAPEAQEEKPKEKGGFFKKFFG